MNQPKWLELAWRDVGVAEKKGVLSNPAVMRYYRDVGADWVKGDDVAWCAAFVGSCLVRGGEKSTRSLMARSYLKWGQKIKGPKKGAVAVFSRGSNPALGHVGFYVGENTRSIFVLGGNQSDAVNIKTFPKSRLLGYRWPSIEKAVGTIGVGAAPVFESALAHVLEFEGGWSNDPQDPGGPTNKGVTLQVYAENKGVKVSSRNRNRLMGELRDVSDEFVRDLYYRRYWKLAHCPELPEAIAFMHFDAAVNHGPRRAVKMLQQAVGVEIDGEVGPLTLAGVKRKGRANTIFAYRGIRERFYRGLSHFPRFGRGWIRRLVACEKRAVEWAENGGNLNGVELERRGADMKENSKWWAQSMTNWGAIVNALATVVPVLGPLMGYDISADMVEQFGVQVARIIQATGGVVGTLMTIYGRLRTVAPLERRKLSFDF